MRRTRIAACIPSVALFVCLLFSCASNTGYTSYREGVFQGLQCLRYGDQQAALVHFLRASQGDPTEVLPLALAGQVAYQMGNYAESSQYLAQAEERKKDRERAYVIVKAYQSLIAFRENRHEEGMAALADYIRVMGNRLFYPEQSFYEVKRMYQSGNIIVPRLEGLINYQISRYERIVT